MAMVYGDFVFTDEEAKVAAEKLKDAMDGCGTNEEAIVEVLVTHNNEQRQLIQSTYESAYGKSLIDELKSELSGDLETCIIGLMLPPRDYDAKLIHDALKGAGTDEKTLIGILCTRTPEELELIKEAYTRMFEHELKEDLTDDIGGYFGRLMYSLATNGRQDCGADEDLAQDEAQKLVDAGVGQLGTDECDFNSVLCLSSYDQLRRVFEKYQEITGNDIEEDIKSEMGGDLQDGYLAIVKCTRDKEAYIAERLNKAMRGWGTDDDELIRLVISRAETDLMYVQQKYMEMFECDLGDDTASECSGHYKQCLMSLIRGQFVPSD